MFFKVIGVLFDVILGPLLVVFHDFLEVCHLEVTGLKKFQLCLKYIVLN